MSNRLYVRKPEGELVRNPAFGLGAHVNLTRQILAEKNTHSPAKWKHYATATYLKHKTQIWFRTPARLKKWKEGIAADELVNWKINIINHVKHEKQKTY